jgi:hypothetical protein
MVVQEVKQPLNKRTTPLVFICEFRHMHLSSHHRFLKNATGPAIEVAPLARTTNSTTKTVEGP